MVKFPKFCSESLHRDTDRRSNVIKFVRREMGEIVHYFADQKILAPSQTVATVRIMPKICQCQPPTIHLQCPIFYPNRFTFGEVIAECVNTVVLPCRVSP